MSNIGWTLAVVLGVLVGLQLLQLVAVVVRLLRQPIPEVRITPLAELPALRPHEVASVAELEVLGFRQIGWGMVERGRWRTPVCWLQHESTPAFASLTLLPSGFGAHAVAFHSFAGDGRHVVTVNREAWSFPATAPQASLADACAGSLEEHWQAHGARIAGIGLEQPDAPEAQRRLVAWFEGYHERLRAKGMLRRVDDNWHFTLPTAARIAWALRRARRKLLRPYRAAALSDEHQGAFFAQHYLFLESNDESRPARHDVKLWVLALSTLLSLVLWGLVFNWQTAIALVAIILFHESGHALAMRAFGYRDMHMFMVPLVGALVTGSSKGLAAWKQAVVLLAGPLPGLLLGIAGVVWLDGHPMAGPGPNWQMATAMMAVFINLFNLLPITPLDGGQLMEVALFSRWPRARFVFVVASVAGFLALAIMEGGPALWVLAVVMAFSMSAQWRVARLQLAWLDGADKERQLVHLFDHARRSLKLQGFFRSHMLIKGVFFSRGIGRPRLWESVLVVCLMSGLWGAVGIAYFAEERPAYATSARAADGRTEAQRVFDHTLWDTEGEDRAGSFEELERLAKKLDHGDPRHVDLAVAKALTAEDDAVRRGQLESVLASGQAGFNYSRYFIAAELLKRVHEKTLDLPPLERAKALERAIDGVAKLAPDAYEGTVEARLRAAEARDRAGDRRGLPQEFEELRAKAPGEFIFVSRAEAWFDLSDGRPADALAVLERAWEQGEPGYERQELSADKAWALIALGRREEALEQMRAGLYTPRRRHSLPERLHLVNPPPYINRPLEMAWALQQAGKPEEARTLLNDHKWACRKAQKEFVRSPWIEPWQEQKEKVLREMAKAVCPTPAPEACAGNS